jgi:SM-20-related protein
MPKQIQINPRHNAKELGRQFLQTGRLQVADFFTAETAEYLHSMLVENKDWYLAYNEGNQYYESPMSELQALDPQKRHQFMNNIYARAQRQFQYVFIQYYITQAIELNEQPGHPMHQMQAFMNSDATLDFMRQLTNEAAITKADSYASCYTPGHFLTDHDDRHDKHNRVAAYVFSMTKKWDVNWGGHLAFYDQIGNITEAFLPTFNCLNIFMVPQRHAVQMVAPFAGANRTSFLGWLHR